MYIFKIIKNILQITEGQIRRSNFAGFPATIVFDSTSWVTTLAAPTTAFSPTVTPGRIVAPAPIHTPLQICIGLQVII